MPENKALEKMREPFAPNQISKMCRSTKKDNPKGKCTKCGGFHGLPAIQLDYVGHAALTDRLLDADPNWLWEPMALDSTGYPVIDKDGGMWIRLTVGGVTRPGYGDAQGKLGGDAIKERIGDALRNAAMRFGAALELWHKGDLHMPEETVGPVAAAGVQPALSPAQQAFYDELAAYRKGDTAQMEATCLDATFYESGEKKFSFGLARLPEASEKWCMNAMKKLKKQIQAETLAAAENTDIPF